MRLNSLKPVKGASKSRTRIGRGIGSGKGKTAGRGHKGQRSRAGGYHKVGFEGGQMPLHRRVPKFGFTPLEKPSSDVVRLHELNKVSGEIVNLETLKAAHIINRRVKSVKIFLSGKLEKPLTVQGLQLTRGAKAAIEAAGGKVE